MAKTTLTLENVEQAVYGGTILGGGGGGWIQAGLQQGKLALEVGTVDLITADELADDDYVTCVSLVGAPAAKQKYVNAKHFLVALEMLQKAFPNPIKALMTNENGAQTTVNGWLQAALTGLPVIDAPCNGRAHPTASMGSLNLSEVEDYISYQAAAGGKGEREISGFVSGKLNYTSNVIRNMSIQAGGMVGVARNPVKNSYVKEHAAVGGISHAISVGEVFLDERDPMNKIEAVATKLQGRVIKVGRVRDFSLVTDGGFDVGKLFVDDLELTFWNEYMTAEINRERKGTFPDLIMTFDAGTGIPVVSAEIENDQKIAVISVPKEHLLLSSTMSNHALLKPVEEVIKKPILP
ncbi:DUF917 family protein [Alkalihalobacillus sp. TS-13]|uniref:DUF917 domain-containing protein n=1 Tax=Alkalihalobacillus sp. TS-13 TaxID=2842455 RepID=UPI001C87F307|nr:DUF917 family protein [Alkalihalobacillus sp. TS-13]